MQSDVELSRNESSFYLHNLNFHSLSSSVLLLAELQL